MPTLNILSIKAAGRHAMRSNYTWGRQYLATLPHLCVYPGKSILACGYLWVAHGGGIDSLQAYKAGWNWCNPRGEPGSPEGKKIPPPLVSRQNWGSESVTPQLCFLTPLLLLLEKIVLCPKGIQIHLVLDNREQTKACSFTLEQHCLTDATAEEPKNDKTALKQLKSRKEKSGLNCHATLSASWGTPGHCCIYISYFVKSLFCRDICSEQGIHEETQRVVTVVDWCRPIRFSYQQWNQARLAELAWTPVPVESQRNTIAVPNALDKRRTH